MHASRTQIDREWLNLPTPPPVLCCFRKCYTSGLNHKQLNRYPDVVPFENTRVKLDTEDAYINASYIEICPRYRFIAAQAPLPQCFTDFWFMIWQKNVSVVVMLSRFVEKRRVKAHCYWPSVIDLVELFGEISVKLTKEEELPHCITVRHFEVSKEGVSRTVVHIHYTEWPDFGVPQTTEGIRQVKKLTDEYSMQLSTSTGDSGDSYPVLVHCSAGVGRAGTFLAYLNYCKLISLGRTHDTLTVGEVVTALRKQRMYMVQTKEQFLFIYRLLQDEFQCEGCTTDQGLLSPMSPTREGCGSPLTPGGSSMLHAKVNGSLVMRSSPGRLYCSKPRSFLRTTQTALETLPFVRHSSTY